MSEEITRTLRKTRVGKVISVKMDKTVVVAIEDNVKHPLYGDQTSFQDQEMAPCFDHRKG